MYERRTAPATLTRSLIGTSEKDRRVEQVDVDRPLELLGEGVARADVDHPGDEPPVANVGVAGEVVDAVEELRVEHRRPTEEVVDQGDADPIEEDARVGRRRAAHQQRAADIGDAGDAG